MVISAYQERCAICRLNHPELLDAAHIIPDSDARGSPVITNGLSLCKIHHAAYDQHIIGIDPDCQVHVC
ncbi:MAG: HNH endonuclease [Spirochaetes bacterium]|nr:HNH endonuclease [Spirochaetota bacterium]